MRYFMLFICVIKIMIPCYGDKIYAKNEDVSISVSAWMDGKEIAETYDHLPEVTLQIEKDDFHDDYIVYVYDLKQQRLKALDGKWEKINTLWSYKSKLPQSGEELVIQIRDKEKVVYESTTFSITSPLETPQFYVHEQKLESGHKYMFAQEVVVRACFTFPMNQEHTKIRSSDKDFELQWDETGKEALFKIEEDGHYSMEYVLEDIYGNQLEGSTRIDIILDRQAPKVHIFIDDDEINAHQIKNIYDHDVSLSFVIQDETFDSTQSSIMLNGKEIKMQWQQHSNEYRSQMVLPQGSYALEYKIKDQLHHETSESFSTFIVDTKAPEVDVSFEKEWLNYPQQIHMQIYDVYPDAKHSELHIIHQGKEFVMQPQWIRNHEGLSADILLQEEGHYEIQLYARDLAGHQVHSSIRAFDIDTHAPEIQVRFNQQKNRLEQWMTNRDVHVASLIQDEHLAKTVITLYCDGKQVFTSNHVNDFVIPAKKDTWHHYVFILEAADMAGNMAKAYHSFSIKTKIAPIVIANDVFHGKPYRFDWTPHLENEDQAYRMIHAILRRNQQIIPYHWGDAIKEEGDYVLDIMAEDDVNNHARLHKSFTFTIDKTAPMVKLFNQKMTGEIRNQATLKEPLVLMIDPFFEDQDGYFNNIFINGKRQEMIQGKSFTFLPSHTGTYIVEANVSDMAGNQAYYSWKFEVIDTNVDYDSLDGFPSYEKPNYVKQDKDSFALPYLWISVGIGMIGIIGYGIYKRKH